QGGPPAPDSHFGPVARRIGIETRVVSSLSRSGARHAMGSFFAERTHSSHRAGLLLAMVMVAAPVSSAPAAPSAMPVPDFSGIWAHPGLGFGPELAGPGPVRNKSRLPSGASNFDQLVGDYSNPILKPEAAEIVKRRGEISLSGRAFADPDNQCLQN